jgi:hypothetical protein
MLGLEYTGQGLRQNLRAGLPAAGPFSGSGRALCHSESLKTGNSIIPQLSNQTAHLWSDQEHRGGKGPKLESEANEVVKRFDRLSEKDKQDLLNFLRSL